MTEIPKDYIRVLDKGYVGLVDKLGTDLTPPRAARTSFAKSPVQYTDEQNSKLVNYLARNKEYSTFRHNALTLEVRMPLMIARQLWKYIVASNFTEDQLGWNENSRRYITDKEEFYLPTKNEWRLAPDNKKQGSGDFMPEFFGEAWTQLLEDHYTVGVNLYEDAIEKGMAPEQARLFLPAYGLYVTVIWTSSLNAMFHVLEERLDSHAQYEIRQYAEAFAKFTKDCFPISYEAWNSNR